MPSTLITGANRGLGLEFARQYLGDGWQVYATCRNPATASELRRLAENSDDKLRILAMDVTDPASIQAAATELDGEAIDLLLNNAGVIGPQGQAIGNIDYKAWVQVFAINTMGPMRVSEAFVEHVARSNRKLIVTLTSGNGIDYRQYLWRFDPLLVVLVILVFLFASRSSQSRASMVELSRTPAISAVAFATPQTGRKECGLFPCKIDAPSLRHATIWARRARCAKVRQIRCVRVC
jgi:NAD(P)-dependent dehydrogenase (short-subunit alcohol dehydrogenase family)